MVLLHLVLLLGDLLPVREVLLPRLSNNNNSNRNDNHDINIYKQYQ